MLLILTRGESFKIVFVIVHRVAVFVVYFIPVNRPMIASGNESLNGEVSLFALDQKSHTKIETAAVSFSQVGLDDTAPLAVNGAAL